MVPVGPIPEASTAEIELVGMAVPMASVAGPLVVRVGLAFTVQLRVMFPAHPEYALLPALLVEPPAPLSRVEPTAVDCPHDVLVEEP